MESIKENILDVTLLEPREKHPTIFRKFDALLEGEQLIINNDHDPKPLFYQLLSERGEIFQWTYLEEGPEVWKVRITKNVTGVAGETVGQIAAKDLRKAQVFKKYGIDFCCGGKKTLAEACQDKGLDVHKIQKELSDSPSTITQRPLPFDEWSPDFLADYIVNNHHAYVKKSLPDLLVYSNKVAAVHGGHHPELLSVSTLVQQLAQELTDHLAKEEMILFPFIKAKVRGEFYRAPFGSVESPIKMMEQEHDDAGQILAELRYVTNGYVLPDDACASYSLLYRLLEEFESDLHMHIHLENNILFPKAMLMQN